MDVDSIRFVLMFERFLNPERVSMPDIDIDFCYNRRDEVIRYVEERYGQDHVSQIITFGTLAARAAVRDVGRALGMSYADVDAAGCAVYFSKMEGREGDFRYDLNNGEVLEVQSVLPKQLAVLGENVYFINQDDQMLYRCRTTDGDLRQALENVPVSAIRRVGSELRYVTADDPDQTENVISMD